jgi:excisionase family DNA binding protein
MIAATERVGYKVPDLAKAMGVSKSLIYKLIASGELNAVRVGERRLIIPVGEVDRLLQPKGDGV